MLCMQIFFARYKETPLHCVLVSVPVSEQLPTLVFTFYWTFLYTMAKYGKPSQILDMENRERGVIDSERFVLVLLTGLKPARSLHYKSNMVMKLWIFSVLRNYHHQLWSVKINKAGGGRSERNINTDILYASVSESSIETTFKITFFTFSINNVIRHISSFTLFCSNTTTLLWRHYATYKNMFVPFSIGLHARSVISFFSSAVV